ncbi:hypothetical protein Efla_003109 [Eimeria flavescens]
MLRTPGGATGGVPYDMQYTVNRLFQGLASPRPCTRQAYAVALVVLLQQLQRQKLPAACVNLIALCQNLRRVFALKQVAPSEVKHLHLARCLGVYVLVALKFFTKKQSLPEVKDVLEMLWEAFQAKMQLQEASGFLIRQVVLQLSEAGQGALALEACEKRLRGLGTFQLLAPSDKLDKAKATEMGKTATGRLPYSLLEVYVRLQADVQQERVPDAPWLHMDVFSSDNLHSLVAFISDTAAAHPRLHGLWDGVMRLLWLRSRDAEQVFSRFWKAVDSKLFPPKADGSRDADAAPKRSQEQTYQNAFVGFRATLLVLQLIKQRLLVLETTGQSDLTQVQLRRMTTSVFAEGKGFARVLLLHLESPRSPLNAIARFTVDKLEEIFSSQGQLAGVQSHPLCSDPCANNSRKRGFVKSLELYSVCGLSCGCQADPYCQGLLEPILRATQDEADHVQPLGEDYKAICEPLRIQPEERVTVLLAFGQACRFQPLKRQSLWRLSSICFSSTRPDELENLAMLLLAAFSKPHSEANISPYGRKAVWVLDSLLMLLELQSNKSADGVKAYSPDWLLSAIVCSCTLDIRIGLSKEQPCKSLYHGAALDDDEMTEAPQATIPEGMDECTIPVRSVQLPRLFLFGLNGVAGRGVKEAASEDHSAFRAALNRMRGKLCSFLGTSCVAAMEKCTRAESCGASDCAHQLHCAHARLCQLMQREKDSSKEGLQLRAKAIDCDGRERKATVIISGKQASSSDVFSEPKDIRQLSEFCYFVSSQGAALAITARSALEKRKSVHSGFVAAAQVLSLALCTISLLPHLLVVGDGKGALDTAQNPSDDENDVDEGAEEFLTGMTPSSAAQALARAEMQSVENTRQEESEDLLDATLHALRVMLQAAKPLHVYLRKCEEGQRDAAVASQTRLAEVSSTLLLLGGNSAASGLIREVAEGLWRSLSCFAPSSSVAKLLQVATASTILTNKAERGSSESDQSEEDEAAEPKELSSDDGEDGVRQEEDEAERSLKKQELRVQDSASKRGGEDDNDGEQASSVESDDDPFAVQLSAEAALEALADDTALPDAYQPPGGFKERGISQRKLILRQRRRFGELRLRALTALQVFVQSNSSSPLALHVLTSLYGVYSNVLVQAAQSRRRKQRLAVYDDLAKKIRRTVDLALKGANASAWILLGRIEKTSVQRRASSISMCCHMLQGQRLHGLLKKARTFSQKAANCRSSGGEEELQMPPLMPTLEDGDAMQLLLEGKKSCCFLVAASEAPERQRSLSAAEHKRILALKVTWILIAEAMVNVLRVCSRKLPAQLANQNQTLGVEILLQLHKLEQQVYEYYTQARETGPSVVLTGDSILTQLLSVALSARAQLRRCHLGWSFFAAFTDRKPELFRSCDLYGAALNCRAPFVRRELGQVALRTYKHPNVPVPVKPAAAKEAASLRGILGHLSSTAVLTCLLSKERGDEAAGRNHFTLASDSESFVIPNKFLQSRARFCVFVVRRLIELLKQTSNMEVKPQQEQQPQGEEPQRKRSSKREVKQAVEAKEGSDGSNRQTFHFSTASQKHVAVCELLKQLQELLQVFARRDGNQRSVADCAVQEEGFKRMLQDQKSLIQQVVQDAAASVGGKKPLALANTIGSVLARIASVGEKERGPDHENGKRTFKRKRSAV